MLMHIIGLMGGNIYCFIELWWLECYKVHCEIKQFICWILMPLNLFPKCKIIQTHCAAESSPCWKTPDEEVVKHDKK